MQLTGKEFEKKWLEYVSMGFGFMKAFDLANDDHERLFGHFRYSDYNSFRIVRDRKK